MTRAAAFRGPINCSFNTHKGALMRKLRLSFSPIAVAASIVAATVTCTAVGSAAAPTAPTKKAAAGQLYMQTNGIRNVVVHYRWSASGTLTEVERVATGGAGCGVMCAIYPLNRPQEC